ncbi:MAG: chemotaxis response regulator protein-glutamate methylesterase, partial [Planctomycetes bacterium]|nr:chemotaxis response regulator protein-glutamate methylesterase [Planctomycetota bacterium]
LTLRQRGWATMGQNEATCSIYGMPMAARELGAIEREVALQDLGRWMVMLCRARRAVGAR